MIGWLRLMDAFLKDSNLPHKLSAILNKNNFFQQEVSPQDFHFSPYLKKKLRKSAYAIGSFYLSLGQSRS